MDFRPFRLIRPKFACKARSTPDRKMIQSKMMYYPWLTGTLIGCLRLCRGVARLEMQNRGIPGSIDFRPFRLIRPKFACKTRLTPDPQMIQSKAIYNPPLSDTLIGCLRLCRGVIRPKVQNRGIPGSMGSRPFLLIRPWFACKASSTPIQRCDSTKL